jgi:hypothetical protein
MSDFKIGTQTEMNKSTTFAGIQSRFFTECIDLANEIELKAGKYKQMSPRLQLDVSRSTKMKIAFLLFPVFLFGYSLTISNIGEMVLHCLKTLNFNILNQNLYR